MWPFKKKAVKLRSYEDYSRDEILIALRKLKYDANAKPSFELLAGASYWTDELPSQNIGTLYAACSIYLRICFAYRHSLSLGKPKAEFEMGWIRIKKEVPNWPGFRDDRIHGRAAKYARVCDRQMKRALADAEREMDNEDKRRANQSLTGST